MKIVKAHFRRGDIYEIRTFEVDCIHGDFAVREVARFCKDDHSYIYSEVEPAEDE